MVGIGEVNKQQACESVLLLLVSKCFPLYLVSGYRIAYSVCDIGK